VVMPKDKVTKLNNYQSEFKDLVDARLPMRLAGDIGAVRRKLIAEYPHAVGAIDVVLRELREGKPVRWPHPADGPAGCRQSRAWCEDRRSARIGVYRYGRSGASDNMFGGSPRAGATRCRRADARRQSDAHRQSDRHGGRDREGRHVVPQRQALDALLPFLERETATRYRTSRWTPS